MGMIKHCVVGSIITLASVFVLTVAAESTLEQALIERIRPVGQVCVEGKECRPAAVTPARAATPPPSTDTAGSNTVTPTVPSPVASNSRSGEDVYYASCTICHAAGVAGAPKFGDAASWEPRIAVGREVMLQNAINGTMGMPPRGTCMNCSDEELDAAIVYMLDSL